ncbi:peptidase inhibitor family I36 protein [Patulibacter defluvii]|uniref:peptidase inhibitor family I36 protein n=1 Tax=Patulibacter defluvii TaxID=3095358 RepID=UPI002A75B041|nr:peptidase inhibitor family I36 protein [Patulibacter sp. DM4]
MWVRVPPPELEALAEAGASIVSGPGERPAAAGECPSGRFCLWFNSGYAGARADFEITDGNLANELFNDGPAGRNGWLVQVEDNAASAYNRTSGAVFVYARRNCDEAGDYDWLSPNQKLNLDQLRFNLKNRVSSVLVFDRLVNRSECSNVDSGGY